MIRLSRILAAALSVVILGSCAPAATPVATPQIATSETPFPHAAEIRLGLIGSVSHSNIWALFDEKGQSYNDYAVESGYWPRLYRFSVPERQFQPQAAAGLPSAIQAEGRYFVGTVPLRSDLKWGDGSPFTAADVAFTVNTVLAFQLGFDWLSFYNPAWLDHAQALDLHTVKFYFKTPPNVAIWQYGVLQGPVAQAAYWTPGIADARSLLPSPELISQIQDLKAKVAGLQAQVNAANASPSASGGSAELKLIQNNLDEAFYDLAKGQASYDHAMDAARQSLYALTDGDEPQLGTWQYSNTLNGVLGNEVNPGFYFDHPHFDRVIYHVYPSWEAAWAALKDGAVDVVLVPGGISPAPVDSTGSVKWMSSPSSSARFLMINESQPVLRDQAVRQALACILNSQSLVSGLNGQAAPLDSFVLPSESFWVNPAATLPCQGLDDSARVARAVQILKVAGYTWDAQPEGSQAGKGLKTPAHVPFPALDLMAPSTDALRSAAAKYIQDRARLLGMPLTARLVGSDVVNYAVLSSSQFDLALVGWRLSANPGYLCDWGGAGGLSVVEEGGASSLSTPCAALDATSDLQAARQLVFNIQSGLAQDLSMIPLYSLLTDDGYRNVTYPFEQVLDGLNGFYGAPALAVPAP